MRIIQLDFGDYAINFKCLAWWCDICNCRYQCYTNKDFIVNHSDLPKLKSGDYLDELQLYLFDREDLWQTIKRV